MSLGAKGSLCPGNNSPSPAKGIFVGSETLRFCFVIVLSFLVIKMGIIQNKTHGKINKRGPGLGSVSKMLGF